MDVTSLFFWELAQQRQIRAASNDARVADSVAHRAEDRAADVQASIERLSLACQALWEILRERASVSEEDLLAKVREIDLRDGRLDGRAKTPPRTCPKCSRSNNARRQKCLYCGTDFADESAFE